MRRALRMIGVGINNHRLSKRTEVHSQQSVFLGLAFDFDFRWTGLLRRQSEPAHQVPRQRCHHHVGSFVDGGVKRCGESLRYDTGNRSIALHEGFFMRWTIARTNQQIQHCTGAGQSHHKRMKSSRYCFSSHGGRSHLILQRDKGRWRSVMR